MPSVFTQFKGSARFGSGASFTVTNKALTSNVATITTSASHGFAVGQLVQVALSPADAVFDGVYVITAVTGTTFSYAKTNANVTSTASGGTATTMVDFKDQITAIKFVFAREKNVIPPTLGTGTEDLEPGVRQRTLEVTFLNRLAQEGFYRRLVQAIDADGELNFDVVLSDAAVSANNPRRTGTVVVPEAQMGGQVGSLRSTTSTFRIKAGTYTKASS